jgi:protein-S-isoprenylcysteine O-methyltransferase Ste14
MGLAPFGIDPIYFRTLALGMMVAGILIRWQAILTLGRFFTTRVAIHDDHRLVQTGMYRTIRHPAYAGLLLTFLGLGVSLGNWVSVLVIVVPITAVFLYRIRIEEESLLEEFGGQYREYCRTSKRLVPWIY